MFYCFTPHLIDVRGKGFSINVTCNSWRSRDALLQVEEQAEEDEKEKDTDPTEEGWYWVLP